MFTIYVTYKGSDRAAVRDFTKKSGKSASIFFHAKRTAMYATNITGLQSMKTSCFFWKSGKQKKLSRYIHSRLTLKSWESSKKNTALKPALKLHKHLFNNVIGNLNEVSKICY
ncbi:MAG: hypothetical protein PUG78_03990 [Eubacteriales bacterium]|nr:hypothetical protein [Eubacteriales bacterium]